MINKWNLSRETTQMAFPIFIPEQKAPPGQGAKGLTSLLIKIGKNLLCRIFLNIGEWTSHLQTVIFPATREFHKLTRNRACLVIAQRPQLSHHVKSVCLWSENCKCFGVLGVLLVVALTDSWAARRVQRVVRSPDSSWRRATLRGRRRSRAKGSHQFPTRHASQSP